MIDGALVVGDAEGESSDSSDDFAAADSGGESDGEDEGLLAKGKRQQKSLTQQKTSATTTTKQIVKNNKINRHALQTPKKISNRSSKPTTPVTPKHIKTQIPAQTTPKRSKAVASGKKTKQQQLPTPDQTPVRPLKKAKPSRVGNGSGSSSRGSTKPTLSQGSKLAAPISPATTPEGTGVSRATQPKILQSQQEPLTQHPDQTSPNI